MKNIGTIQLVSFIISAFWSAIAALGADTGHGAGDYFSWIINLMMFGQCVIIGVLYLISVIKTMSAYESGEIRGRGVLIAGLICTVIFWLFAEFGPSNSGDHQHHYFLVFISPLAFGLTFLFLSREKTN